MNLIDISNKSLPIIKAEWLSGQPCDEDDLSKFDYEQLFNVIESTGAFGKLNSKYNTSIFFALQDDAGKTSAIVELIQSRKGKEIWVKVIDIYIAPTIEFCTNTAESITLRVEVFASVVVGVFGMFHAGIDIVKVYGRTDNLLSFLRTTHGIMIAKDIERKTGIATTIEGRWLVFRAAA